VYGVAGDKDERKKGKKEDKQAFVGSLSFEFLILNWNVELKCCDFGMLVL
jgi:hypothetical protein